MDIACARPQTDLAYESVCGDKRVFVQGMEGAVLSRGPAGQTDAPLLRGALSVVGDQQYRLPHAEGLNARTVGSRGARRFQVRAQGPATDHTHQTTQGSGRFGGVFAQGRRGVERTPRPVAVSMP